jgi:hypothetical protein
MKLVHVICRYHLHLGNEPDNYIGIPGRSRMQPRRMVPYIRHILIDAGHSVTDVVVCCTSAGVCDVQDCMMYLYNAYPDYYLEPLLWPVVPPVPNVLPVVNAA